MKRRILLVLLLLAALSAVGLWRTRQRGAARAAELAASGTVEATEARLGFETGGRLAEVSVREGDEVAAGAIIARLDASEAAARKAQAAAQVEVAVARRDEAEAGFRSEEVAQGKAALEGTELRLKNSEEELARAESLLAGGAISKEARDRARLARDVVASEQAAARERVQLLEKGSRREAIAAARAAVTQAEAALATADAALAKLTLRAPFAGRVSERHHEPGETVSPGAPVVTLLDPNDRWVRIYVPETRLGRVRLGAGASIRSDTFPDKTYRGSVVYIASQAEFTPKSVQTQEERVRLVYAVKVRVVDDPAFELKPGLPVDVTLEP